MCLAPDGLVVEEVHEAVSIAVGRSINRCLIEQKRVVTMMLAFGRCRRLAVVTTDVSDVRDDCADAADVGEGVLTLSFLMCPLLLLLHLLQDVMMMTYVVVVAVVS